MVAVRCVANKQSKVNGVEVIATTVAVVNLSSTDSVCPVAEAKPVSFKVVSLRMMESDI